MRQKRLRRSRHRRQATVLASRSVIESLECRQLLNGTSVFALNTQDLIDDVAADNTSGGSNIIKLSQGVTYDFTDVNNDWYGPNALPAISSNLTIQGNGA